LTKLALHSLFVSEDTFFCLIVQFSKFVVSFSATLISYQVTDTIVNNFFDIFFGVSQPFAAQEVIYHGVFVYTSVLLEKHLK